MLCAHGWAEQTQLPCWRHISQNEIRKIAAAKKEAAKARARRAFIFPTPLRHALARTALFFGVIGGCANFIGAPPSNFCY